MTANRANARESKGPRSDAGKRRSAGNAVRLGLAVPVMANPALAGEVEALARDIAGAGANARMYELAWRIAEAQIDLARVRRARHAILSGIPADGEYRSLKTRGTGVAVAGLVQEVAPQIPAPPEIVSFTKSKSEGPREFVAILGNMAQQLAAIDRYERRVVSRRKFAIRAFDVARQQIASAPKDEGERG